MMEIPKMGISDWEIFKPADWEFTKATITAVNKKTGQTLTREYHRPSKNIIDEIYFMVPDVRDEKNVFYDFGDYWFIKFDGQAIFIKNEDGLHYIKELLSQPKIQISVESLSLSVKGYSVLDKEQIENAEKYGKMTAEQLNEEGMNAYLCEVADELTPEECEGYEEEIGNLFNEIDRTGKNGLLEKMDATKEALTKILRILEEGYGISFWRHKSGNVVFKRWKQQNKDADKRRTSIYNRIKEAHDLISSYHPNLAYHLKTYIKTGSEYCYDPGPDVPKWYIGRK